jgi:hypothetical protein
MALTPEGSPYVQSSDLVATYPTTSLALANRVDLVGVLPFATSADRATAIPSPTDGQYSYLQDTNLTQFWNGSAWQTAGLTPGLSLVTPTSIANSGGTSSLSGSEVTFTGVTSVSLNGVFTSTYQNYFISANVQNSAATDVLFRLRVAGTDNSTNNYRTAYAYTSGATAWTVGQQNPGTHGFIGWATTFPALITMNLGNPQSASETSGMSIAPASPGAPTVGMFLFAFRKDDSTQYDGITLYLGAGNMTGKVRVYSYQNS